MKIDFLLRSNSESIWNRLKDIVAGKVSAPIMVCFAICIAGSVFAFPLSFITKSNVLIGFGLFPFVLFYTQKTRFNYFYLASLIFFLVVTNIYHIRIFYFFALAFFILFATELWIRTVNKIILFLLIFMSPVFQQAAIILGFPVRLQLSSLAGNILSWSGMPVQVEGNMMILNGASFSVDEACMGLSMLAFSMLMGVLAIAHQYRIRNVQLSISKLLLFFLIVFAFNLICNVLRIFVLVVFKIAPENPMHEMVGILCFVMYVMIPLYFVSRWMISRYGNHMKEENGTIRVHYLAKSGIGILSIAILLTGIQLNRSRGEVTISHASASLAGFKSTNLNGDITKLTNNNVLIYVKPIPEFFTSEHTPLLCWKGSGYHFESIRNVIVLEKTIYVGELVKEKNTLYTAWWYCNGKVETINQLDWRLRMLKGEDQFCLINVTSDSEVDMQRTLELILKNKQLNLSSN